jgi:endonuclease G, mitochondrial
VTLAVPLQITIQLGSGAVGAAPRGEAAFAEAFGAGAPVNIDPDYGNREGYDPRFLAGAEVPLPKLSKQLRRYAATVSETDEWAEEFELKYHHFSLVMNAARRLAFFTAVNIDGKAHRQEDLKRGKDKWYFDPRVPKMAQLGEELYRANLFDRGHLVRRLDPAWGRTTRIAKTGNDDTFHFTNCSPQHERFNQGKNLWAGLEDYLLKKATGEEKRLTVFTGPVFDDAGDPDHRGVQIPKQYWKVAVVGRPGGKVAALGFIVSQEKLLRSMTDVAFDAAAVAEMFQTSVANVEAATGLDFGGLDQVDVGAVEDFAPGQPPLRKLEDHDDIRLGG